MSTRANAWRLGGWLVMAALGSQVSGCDHVGKQRAFLPTASGVPGQPAGTAAAGAPTLPPPVASASTPEGAPILHQLSDALAQLAARGRPALVSVSVSKVGHANVGGGWPQLAPGAPDDLRDFFDRFFGPARPGAPAPDAAPPAPVPHLSGMGSGFLIDGDNGYIVTNNHVVEGADEISIHLASGETSAAKVIGRDPNTDLAVVQLVRGTTPKTNLPTMVFADSDKVRVGDLALALGAPFGLEASLSFGIVSATGRGGLGIAQIGDFLQTDAAINPGNSGGPLLDAAGQVIGVNTAIFSQSGSFGGIGFAIPSNMAKLVAQRLIAHGKVDRGYLGLTLQALSSDLRQPLKLPAGVTGALVAETRPDSPGAKAGIRPGDVVTGVNGKPLHSDFELVNTVGLMEPGQTVQLQVWRDGRSETVPVTLGPWPESAPRVAAVTPPAQGGALGLTLVPVSPALQERFRFTSDSGAVVVRAEGPAARAGIVAGDVLVAIGNQPVKDPKDVVAQAGAASGPPLLVRCERRGSFYYTVVRREPAAAAETSH